MGVRSFSSTYDKASDNQLNNQKNTDASTQIRGQTVKTRCDKHAGLTEGNDDSEHCDNISTPEGPDVSLVLPYTFALFGIVRDLISCQD